MLRIYHKSSALYKEGLHKMLTYIALKTFTPSPQLAGLTLHIWFQSPNAMKNAELSSPIPKLGHLD